MASSIIYNSCLEDLAKSAIDFDTDTFKVLLVDATYAAVADETKKDSHTKRSDVNGNEITGTGYSAGGFSVTVSVTKDTGNNRVNISLGGGTVSTATLTAYGAVYYKSRGGLASADEVIAYIDFGGAITATAADFALSASTLRLAN
jgi:hypothetical protein